MSQGKICPRCDTSDCRSLPADEETSRMQVAAALFGGATLIRQPYPYKAGHATHTIVSYLDLTECLTAYTSWSGAKYRIHVWLSDGARDLWL